jgi:hypothetical protein
MTAAARVDVEMNLPVAITAIQRPAAPISATSMAAPMSSKATAIQHQDRRNA